MMFAWLFRMVTGRTVPAPAAQRDESEMERIAERVRRFREDESPYLCRACEHLTSTPQCPLCRGKTWVREVGAEPHDVLPPGGAA